VLDAAFGPEYIIVKATASHQRQGVDRFFVHRRDGRMIYRGLQVRRGRRHDL
jgi:hypothetical protein